VRRSTASMLVVLGALSTPLAAQAAGDSGGGRGRGAAIGVGFTATVGSGWQIESGEIGYARRLARGPVRAVAASARLGSFIDEGAILGGARGFVFAGTLSARSGRLLLAELGDEHNLTAIGFDVTLETTGYLTTRSPLLRGSKWAAVALLPGVRIGGVDGTQYGIVIGPTAFLGGGVKAEVRGLLAFRVEAPLARRESHP
jgi:hypothetical protein